MNSYMVPVSEEFIEKVAKAIAKNRLYEDSVGLIQEMTGRKFSEGHVPDQPFDLVFEQLWAGNSPHDELQKSTYRSDARAAISAINLEILISN